MTNDEMFRALVAHDYGMAAMQLVRNELWTAAQYRGGSSVYAAMAWTIHRELAEARSRARGRA